MNKMNNKLPCIVINRMCTGSYLESYLGYDALNLHKADNGEWYLYLNSDGMLYRNQRNIGIMLMVKPVGGYTVEVFAKATNLKIVDGVFRPQISNAPLNREQTIFIQKENITYKGVSIVDIYRLNPPQPVYVTFKTSSVVFVKPETRVFIQFNKATPNSHGPGHYVSVTGIGYPNSSLRNIVCPENGNNNDYHKLINDIINNNSLWETNYVDRSDSVCPELNKRFNDRINAIKSKP